MKYTVCQCMCPDAVKKMPPVKGLHGANGHVSLLHAEKLRRQKVNPGVQ